MTEVIPFTGILYNASRVSGDDVVAPPYDIITPELRELLYQKSPYNIVRIDAGAEASGDHEGENKYLRAASFLKEWLSEGILVRSERPCFYAYEMSYQAPEGLRRTCGLFGLVRLEELGKGVYPHEETHSKPKIDRFNLMAACEANTSPIFSLYNSPARMASGVIERVARREPYLHALDIQGASHRLWIIDNGEDIGIIRSDLAGKSIVIADGHHRYETALEYQRLKGRTASSEPRDYVLMFLANIADGGLTILPTHRIVRYNEDNALEILSRRFEIESVPADDDITVLIGGRTQVFGFCRKGDSSQYLLRYTGGELKGIPPALKGLDVTILHELILKELLTVSAILYEMDASEARRRVRSGDYDAVFFVNPTRVEDVERVALSVTRMPPKSTYFYPKVMTGFVINSLTNSI
ncbi:MAG TPA: DUF1015 domain-containing protein [Thermodesulfovibrionales bacterium]|jgi:uncharacterized protein (DUF1015 family)|nr:DUF1015 domain-containing protein [Thermodesulfovibrionales bacterium]